MSPFWPSLPPSGRPTFAAIDIASIPVNPCGFALIYSVLPPQFLEPLPPPCRPQPAAWYLSVPRRFVPPVTGLLSSSVVLPLHPLLCCPVSWCLLVFCRLMGALLRADKRPGHLHYLAVALPSSRPCATWPFRRLSGHLPPPPPPLSLPSLM